MTTDLSIKQHRYLTGNALVCADNLDVLCELPDDCIDLVYLDPPFNSNHDYVAAFGDKGRVEAQLRDIWRWTEASERIYNRMPDGRLRNVVTAIRSLCGETSPMAAYILFMGLRLAELNRVLKPMGSLYLHCDQTASHYLKILMDAVLTDYEFRSEVTWRRTASHGDSLSFGNICDKLLFYGQAIFVDAVRIPLDEDAVKQYTYKDERGPYRAVNMKNHSLRGGGYNYTFHGWSGPWLYPEDAMLALEADGRIHLPKKAGGKPQRKDYLHEHKGVAPSNLWTDIKKVSGSEKLGYPTQKPLALLERIIRASSQEEDVVLDPFGGHGTTADAAAKLNRRYLGIDVSAIAVRVMEQRLASRGGAAMPVVFKMTWDEYDWQDFERRALMHKEDAMDGLPGWAWAEDKVAGLLNALPNSRKVGDGGVDAIYYAEHGMKLPIQVKMHKGQIGRPELDKLVGVQTTMQRQGINAPVALMVTLYPSSDNLHVFAASHGQVTLRGQVYDKLQLVSVQEMLTKQVRPKLPPVDPRYFVGDTQTRLAIG